MLEVPLLVENSTPLSLSFLRLRCNGGSGEKEWKERENFLFSVVEGTSPKKREKERAKQERREVKSL
jgi:hypothetical protein